MAYRSRAADRAGTARRGLKISGYDDKIALAALAGVTLLIGGVETARAGVITETDSFTIGPSSGFGNEGLSFGMFDSGLGTLTGVSFVLSSATTTSVTIDVAATESATINATATNSANFSVVVENPNLTLFATSSSASASCSASFGPCTGTGSNGPVAFDGTAAVPTPDIADFVGLGNFTVNLNYANDPSVTSCTNNNCTATGAVTWNDAPGALAVEYEYQTAGAVPEPSTLVLFASGLFSFAGLLRGRARKGGSG